MDTHSGWQSWCFLGLERKCQKNSQTDDNELVSWISDPCQSNFIGLDP